MKKMLLLSPSYMPPMCYKHYLDYLCYSQHMVLSCSKKYIPGDQNSEHNLAITELHFLQHEELSRNQMITVGRPSQRVAIRASGLQSQLRHLTMGNAFILFDRNGSSITISLTHSWHRKSGSANYNHYCAWQNLTKNKSSQRIKFKLQCSETGRFFHCCFISPTCLYRSLTRMPNLVDPSFSSAPYTFFSLW